MFEVVLGENAVYEAGDLLVNLIWLVLSYGLELPQKGKIHPMSCSLVVVGLIHVNFVFRGIIKIFLKLFIMLLKKS